MKKIETFHAIILGILQGVTEFLPVSSSGHLVLMQNLLGFKEAELLFDICLHVGTLIAVIFIFYREIISIIQTMFKLPHLIRTSGSVKILFKTNQDVRIALLIIAGTIPTGILGFLFNKIADRIFGETWIVGIMLLITGTLLWITRLVNHKGRVISGMHIKDALLIGLIQGMAIIPGISRSGSTISIALFLGINREVAGRYSFLLSIPAILGAFVVRLDLPISQTSVSFGNILAGTLLAAFVGYFALRILMKIVKNGRLYYFAPYCWILGALALVYNWYF